MAKCNRCAYAVGEVQPMAVLEQEEFLVTEEKTRVLVEKIVAAAHPVAVLVFGSRARKDHRRESDLDLAVIVEDESETVRDRIHEAASGRTMSVDLVILSRARFDEFRPWQNTLERCIDREGVRVYVRDDQSGHSEAA